MENRYDSKTKRIALDGMFAALGIILGYVETLIPVSFAIPGIKLGLANIVVLYVLLTMKPTDAITVSVIRVLAVGFMFGNMNSIIYSISGALFSFAIMWGMLKFSYFHVIVVSVFGALFHVLGQLLAGVFWYPVNVLFYYGMFIVIAAVVTGIINGIIVDTAKRYIYNKLI